MPRVVKQFLVEAEVDVDEWCQEYSVDEATALEQADGDCREGLDVRMAELSAAGGGQLVKWSAKELEKPAADLQVAVENAIETGIIAGAVAKWGGPASKYVPLPPEQKRFAAFEAIAAIRRHMQVEVKPYSVCGFRDELGYLYVTAVFEQHLQAVDSIESFEFDNRVMTPYSTHVWAEDPEKAAHIACSELE